MAIGLLLKCPAEAQGLIIKESLTVLTWLLLAFLTPARAAEGAAQASTTPRRS